MKESAKGVPNENKTDSSSVEPQSDMLVITVDSSKEQKDVSGENTVEASGTDESQSKAEMTPQLCPDIPPEVVPNNSDIIVDVKSVSLGSVTNGVIDASYASDVSSKLNTSKEQEALNGSFEHQVSVCISKEERTWINQVTKQNLERRLKEKEEALKLKEKQLQARIEELETENIEFKLEMLAQHDASDNSMNDDQEKEYTPKSPVRKGKPICIICHEKFTMKAELKAHISKKHKQSLPNSCPHCYKDFKTKKSLNNHIDSAHYDWKSIVNKEQCDHCEQKFGTTEELEAHMDNCHHKVSVTDGSEANHKHTEKGIDTKIKQKEDEEKNAKARQSVKDSVPRKHKCDLCSDSFDTKCLLVKHLTLDHPDADLPEQTVVELSLPTHRR